MHAKFFYKIGLNTANDGVSAKASPFHSLIILGNNDCPYWLVVCMANLSKFHVVFSSSTIIRLDKDAFEGHLCQTFNNFVKQNKSSLLSPLRKRRPPLVYCNHYSIDILVICGRNKTNKPGDVSPFQDNKGQLITINITKAKLLNNNFYLYSSRTLILIFFTEC